MTTKGITSLVLTASLGLSASAFAAHPKKGAGWGDHGDSTTSQSDLGIITLATDPHGKVFDFSFSYGCKTDQPTVDVNRSTREYFKNKRHPALKVSKAGRFSFKGKVKTFGGVSSIDQGGPYKTASVVLHGHFTTKTTAVGTFTLTEAGCQTGKVSWTAKAH